MVQMATGGSSECLNESLAIVDCISANPTLSMPKTYVYTKLCVDIANA